MLRGNRKTIHVQTVYVEPSDIIIISLYCAKQKALINNQNKMPFMVNIMGYICKASSDNLINEIFPEAGRYIIESGKASIGNLQRKFRIGFNRAVRLIDLLVEYGVVTADTGTGPRRVLMDMDEFEQLLMKLL